MFYKKNDNEYRMPMEGVRLKTLVYGEKTSLCEFRLKRGKAIPSHKHPHEQAGYLVSGQMKLTIGDDTFDVEPGDSWCIPGNVEHSAECLQDSIVVEVFSPVREDYLT